MCKSCVEISWRCVPYCAPGMCKLLSNLLEMKPGRFAPGTTAMFWI